MAHSAQKLTFATLRVYLHAVATTQVELGFKSPLSEEGSVWRMYRGIKRLQGAAARRQRLPITTNILDKLEGQQDTETLAGACVRAAMWLATCGLLRSGEVAYRSRDSVILRRKDLTFHDEDGLEIEDHQKHREASYMKLRLLQSKTDPFRQGVDIIIANDRAIAAMCDYLTIKRLSATDSNALFDVGGGACLTVSMLVAKTQSMLNKAGIVNAHLYKGHSFRKGGATSLHEAGMPDSLIKTMGRWLSFAFATYVSTSDKLLIKAGKAMTTARVLARKVCFDPSKITTWD